jgi:hypothetical protein
MDVTYRPLRKKERQELQGYVSSGIWLLRAVAFAAAMAVVGLVLRGAHSLMSSRFPAFAHDAWWVVPLLALALALYGRSRRWTGGREFRARVRADLARGEVAVRRIVAVDAVEIEEQEDEGPGFFLLTSDGTTILFAGQYLDRLKSKGFPWTTFEISESPDARVFFGISGAGDRLKPSGCRSPLTYEEGKAFGIFSVNYRTVDVDFASLKQSLAQKDRTQE